MRFPRAILSTPSARAEWPHRRHLCRMGRASTIRTVIVPWQVIDGRKPPGAFVQTLNATPARRASRTSISGAPHLRHGLLGKVPNKGLRRVIDVSATAPTTRAR